MTKIEAAAEKVAGNAMLQAGARIVMIIGVPVTIGIAGAYAGSITSMGHKIQAIEVGQASTAATLAAMGTRLSALEATNTTESVRFAALEREIAALVATVNATNRNVERLLNRIDASR